MVKSGSDLHDTALKLAKQLKEIEDRLGGGGDGQPPASQSDLNLFRALGEQIIGKATR